MSLSFLHKGRVHFTGTASMIRDTCTCTLENENSCGEIKLNKPTDKRSTAKRNSHNKEPPINQIPQRRHLFLLNYRDGSSQANSV